MNREDMIRAVKALKEPMGLAERLRWFACNLHLVDPNGELEGGSASLATWRESGFPQIVLPHRLAASLAATSFPRPFDAAKPWPSFLIQVPQGVLPCSNGIDTCVSALRVTPDHAATALGSDMWWAPQVYCEGDLEIGWTGPPPGRITDRLLELSYNLIAGVLIELDTPRMKELIRLGPRRSGSNKRKSPVPTAWTFRLTRDVKVDVREGVRSYLLGTVGKSPTVQCLVRGHHKRQAFGPGLAERKWIHIEPYWRGPEDAPIAVRSHIIEEAG